jgi:hypothetical protein
VLLAAQLAEPSALDVLLRWHPDGVTVVAVAGQAAPPGHGLLLAGACRSTVPGVGIDGRAALIAPIAGGSGGRALLLAHAAGPPTPLLAEGALLPTGETIASLDGTPARHVGATSVAARLSPGDVPVLITMADGGEPWVRARRGQPVAGGASIQTLGRVLHASPSGALPLAATLSGTPSGPAILASRADGSLGLVVGSGTPAPGGGQFASFGFAPSAAGEDDIAFLAYTSGARIGGGIYRARGGLAAGGAPPVIEALARAGDPAPGGGTFVSFDEPAAGSSGVIAFRATLSGGRVALFRLASEGLAFLLDTSSTLPAGESVQGIGASSVDGEGRLQALLETAAGRLLAEIDPAGAVEILLRTGDPGPPGTATVIADFGDPAAAGDSIVAACADLEGWSAGAVLLLAARDGDGDGRGDPADCAPEDASAFALLPPVSGLVAAHTAGSSGSIGLTWTTAAGGSEGDTFEILSGPLPVSSVGSPGEAIASGAACVAAGIATPAWSESTPSPLAPGEGRWYLPRARNACDSGPAGEETTAAALAGVECPVFQ